MKTVAKLKDELPRVQVMRSAKGEAVIQEDTPVCNIHRLKVYRNALAQVLAQRDVERRVRPEMVAGYRRISVCKSLAVVHVRRCGRPPRQSVGATRMQRIPLVVIQQSESVPKREV